MMKRSNDFEFKQRNLVERRYFKLTSTGLRIRDIQLFKTNEYEVDFENIGSKIIEYSGGKRGWLIASVVLIAISLAVFAVRLSDGDVENSAEVFYLAIAFITFTAYLFTFKRVLYLCKRDNSAAIEFFKNSPSQNELNNFIDEILLTRNSYLTSRYGKLDRNLSYEPQYNNLNWLLDNEVLNATEFEEKKAELKEMFPPNAVVKGFRIQD